MKKLSKALLALGVVGVLNTTGCATYRTLEVRSEPQGAEVRVDGEFRGTTPLKTTLIFNSKAERKHIEVRKEAYRAATKIHHEMDGDRLEVQLEAQTQAPAGPY